MRPKANLLLRKGLFNMMTARLRRVVNHTLRLLNQFDREHLNEENNKVLDALFDYFENEKIMEE